jgi:glycosyltransferase involved in cell wall biosynthesis
MVGMEKISIITPVLNRREFVAEAIESVLNEQGDGFELEHIVVDGGSTDGTLDVLGRYRHLHVVSGRDRGVYDAINKGIRAASGAIVGLLNSDDVLLPGTLAAVARAFAQKPGPEMLCLSARLARRENGAWRTLEEFSAGDHANPVLADLLAGPILTNSRFYRRDVLLQTGLFDLDYPLIADRKLLVELMQRGKSFEPVEHMALEYRSHPGSLTFTEQPEALLKGIPEKLGLAEAFLARDDLARETRSDFRLWHGHEVLIGLVLAARTRSPSAWIRLFTRGFQGSLLWPLAVLPEAGRLLRRRLGHRHSGATGS